MFNFEVNIQIFFEKYIDVYSKFLCRNIVKQKLTELILIFQ